MPFTSNCNYHIKCICYMLADSIIVYFIKEIPLFTFVCNKHLFTRVIVCVLDYLFCDQVNIKTYEK